MTTVQTIPVLLAVAFLSPIASPQNSPAADPDKKEVDPHKLVELGGIEVNGSRLPANSILRLSALKVGQKVNYDLINEACHRITSTGLVSLVDYAYTLEPGKPGVVLSLKISDELPLLPAKVYPPEDGDQIWGCLQSADPIFTRELPNTRNALGFYATNINRCLQDAGLRKIYARPSVVCDRLGKAAEIVFSIREKEASAARK
ncbi:MAG: hypothetical protein ACR2IV_02275 [Bryobacteraceae bacterium]